MARVKGRDTEPELHVRSTLHRLGFRFRLHRGNLPGRPDIVLPRHHRVVLVHGCFWHQRCARATIPSSNTEFWERKLLRNQVRDSESILALTELGWTPLVVWECETRDHALLENRLRAFLSHNGL